MNFLAVLGDFIMSLHNFCPCAKLYVIVSPVRVVSHILPYLFKYGDSMCVYIYIYAWHIYIYIEIYMYICICMFTYTVLEKTFLKLLSFI